MKAPELTKDEKISLVEATLRSCKSKDQTLSFFLCVELGSRLHKMFPVKYPEQINFLREIFYAVPEFKEFQPRGRKRDDSWFKYNSHDPEATKAANASRIDILEKLLNNLKNKSE